ncbi:hypothetical protein Dsin_008719 [Dipteronia sinensis]|uniref:RNase H type-1 domain-containing protein n=1 Tax=Dipteronia sinensis TaxID=43782 RepID=A0AAE0EB72_9ROSI|nr:hypothetical protein Dsin_008719 [Dipteronia sinensis]
MLFYAVVWSIWEARNHVVFKGVPAEKTALVDLVRFRVAWWFQNHGKGSKEPITVMVENLEFCCLEEKLVKTRKPKKWIPPLDEALKFNVDGSVRMERGRAGIGGVLRDSKGVVLCSFSASVGKVDASTAEVMAIHKACQLCGSKGEVAGRSICFESDSKTAVSWVEDGDFGNLALVEVIYDIRSMLRLHSNWNVSFASRDLNLLANCLAKQRVFMEGENVI